MSPQKQAQAVTVGFLGGLLLGAVVWSVQMQRSRRELFSKSRVKRLAALGYLAGQPSFDTAKILTDYVGWEPHPILKKRGENALRRMEIHLQAHLEQD